MGRLVLPVAGGAVRAADRGRRGAQHDRQLQRPPRADGRGRAVAPRRADAAQRPCAGGGPDAHRTAGQAVERVGEGGGGRAEDVPHAAGRHADHARPGPCGRVCVCSAPCGARGHLGEGKRNGVPSGVGVRRRRCGLCCCLPPSTQRSAACVHTHPRRPAYACPCPCRVCVRAGGLVVRASALARGARRSRLRVAGGCSAATAPRVPPPAPRRLWRC